MTKTTIKEAFPEEFNLIRDLAERTWPATYGKILSAQQLRFMLDTGYSDETLAKSYHDGARFLLAEHGGAFVGFASYQHNFREEGRTHIQKIYVLPSVQGKNIGRQLMDEMEALARGNGAQKMTLNVNRHNPAQHFYARLGYEIAETIDIPIGRGYLMEDYIMEKKL